VQRKVFRIEQMMASHGERRRTPTPTPAAPDRDLIALHDLVAHHKRELATLIHDGEHRRMTVAAGELGAAVEAMEKATHDILESAESIDASARLLNANAKSDRERVLTRDMQNKVAQIYEACNFQDLAGQRIGKVIEMLGMIEGQLAAMLGQDDTASQPAVKSENGLINGPKLDGASGHVSQHDIDMLFG
jgi:chemotaxis protein CheZ